MFRQAKLLGLVRQIPGICMFVHPVFEIATTMRVMQKSEAGLLAGFQEVCWHPQSFCGIGFHLTVEIGQPTMWAFEVKQDEFVLGNAGSLVVPLQRIRKRRGLDDAVRNAIDGFLEVYAKSARDQAESSILVRAYPSADKLSQRVSPRTKQIESTGILRRPSMDAQWRALSNWIDVKEEADDSFEDSGDVRSLEDAFEYSKNFEVGSTRYLLAPVAHLASQYDASSSRVRFALEKLIAERLAASEYVCDRNKLVALLAIAGRFALTDLANAFFVAFVRQPRAVRWSDAQLNIALASFAKAIFYAREDQSEELSSYALTLQTFAGATLGNCLITAAALRSENVDGVQTVLTLARMTYGRRLFRSESEEEAAFVRNTVVALSYKLFTPLIGAWPILAGESSGMSYIEALTNPANGALHLGESTYRRFGDEGAHYLTAAEPIRGWWEQQALEDIKVPTQNDSAVGIELSNLVESYRHRRPAGAFSAGLAAKTNRQHHVHVN